MVNLTYFALVSYTVWVHIQTSKLIKKEENYLVNYSNLSTFAFNLLKNYSIHATKYDLIFFCKEKELVPLLSTFVTILKLFGKTWFYNILMFPQFKARQ
jgi:hypothetical protein